MHTRREVVKVSLFGNLQISLEGDNGIVSIGEDEFRSPTLVRLFSYIAKNHGRIIPSNEIILALWTEESAENPLSVLKNLIYRLRRLLNRLDPESEFIITGKKAYYWNPEIDIEIDVDVFDVELSAAYEEADKFGNNFQTLSELAWNEQKKEIKEMRERFLSAEALYKGTFLSRHQDMFWAVSLGIHYESAYKGMIYRACDILYAMKDFEKMEEIATKAISHDPLSEDLYSYQIKAMIAQGKMKLALDQYHKAEEVLYESLDLDVTEKLQSLWPLLMEQTQSKEKNIKKVQKELLDDYEQGAFFCEYGTFKKIYQLELRRAGRMGISIFMSLLTVGFTVLDKELSPEKQSRLLNTSMDNLKEILRKNLRSGDVITRYSKSQYIVLLPTCQYETAKMVMKRIEKSYNSKYKRTDVELEYSLDSI